MNIAIILALLRQLDPKDVAAIVAALVQFIDPIIASKGPLVRAAWRIIKTILPTEQFAGEIASQSQAYFAANPQIASQVNPQA